MLSLAERVDRTILRYSLLPPGARVLVALSGGADSTALACLLVELASRRGFRVVAAAHFNHGLRTASVEDESFCRALAAQLGIGWVGGAGDVRSLAAHEGVSLEDAGRRLRYDFLHRAAGECEATHVAVGHTLDDQAETVLLQMIRGAGPRGLGGMAPSRRLQPTSGIDVRLVRPLLEVRHQEVVAWLAARGQAFREDESNRDLRFVRNRVRHEVIPLLRARLSPGVEAVLARNAEIAASDAAYLEEQSRRSYAALASVEAGLVRFDAAALLAEPEPIRRRVILMGLRNLGAGRFVGRDQVARACALAEGVLRGPVALPGAVARRVGGWLVFERPPAASRPVEGMNFSRRALSIPGEVRVPGGVISCFIRHMDEPADASRLALGEPDRSRAVLDASRLPALAVRTRLAGDWFRPLGMGGRRKKLQDYFVDRKVPRAMRDSVPLVVDGLDRIAWVVGHGIDEEFRVREGTHDVVILSMRGDSF
jgi:tRNA(Ile)-lysidine synthase